MLKQKQRKRARGRGEPRNISFKINSNLIVSGILLILTSAIPDYADFFHDKTKTIRNAIFSDLVIQYWSSHGLYGLQITSSSASSTSPSLRSMHPRVFTCILRIKYVG